MQWAKVVWNWIVIVNIGNPKSENSQVYAQKPQQNCTLMNSASGLVTPTNTTRTLSRLSSSEVTSAGTASWDLIIACVGKSSPGRSRYGAKNRFQEPSLEFSSRAT